MSEPIHGVDIHSLSDEQLEALRRAVMREHVLRSRLDASPEKITAVIAEYQQKMGREDGEQWKQPTSALDSYPKGAVVEHDGALYTSTTAANVWSPALSGWRLMPETDEHGREIPPPFKSPTGNHDSYQEGERVTFDGEVWEAVRDGVVHSPAEYAADWRLVEDESESDPEPPEDDEEPVDPDEPGEDDSGEDDGDQDDGDQGDGEPELPEWAPDGHNYAAGDEFIYNGATYVVVQAHTSQPGWMPDMVPALYERQ